MGARQVNLTPGDTPQDPYAGVAEMVRYSTLHCVLFANIYGELSEIHNAHSYPYALVCVVYGGGAAEAEGCG